MFDVIDNIFPWLGDMVDTGGNIFLLIIILAAVMWGLFMERLLFIHYVYPVHLTSIRTQWEARKGSQVLSEERLRQYFISLAQSELKKFLSLLKTMIKVCPLLGLLGTVLGMLEVFDAISITGSNSPRATASGVSKAIFTTMAGMVVAISGLLMMSYLGNRVAKEKEHIKKVLVDE